MSNAEASHNLLIVSDMHVAEGLLPEAGECCYGHEAFLYDGAFARFLHYHQQQRWEAESRLASPQRPDRTAQQTVKERGRGGNTDDGTPDELLLRPWRLIIAGDFIDFWDIARVPGDHHALRLALGEQLQAFEDNPTVVDWICRQLDRLERAAPTGEIPDECDGRALDTGPVSEHGDEPSQRDYKTVRDELERMDLNYGPQRRTIEQLAWWIESLLPKDGLKLTTREQRHGLGTTWQEVVWKLTHVYRGHRELFAALAWFIACGNEVVLLKGNHDIELYWPQVHRGQFPYLLTDAYRDLLDGVPIGPTLDQHLLVLPQNPPSLARFRTWLPDYKPEIESDTGDAGKRYRFVQWIYYEKDLVYVEHGNQYEPADASESFLAPEWPREEKEKRIELPWGGFMARYIYNKIVAVHPFAVNIKPESRIIHWMIANDFFRIVGIILAELPDALEALKRALRQGLRSGWIWGDRSILGLIALGASDFNRLRYPDRTERVRQIGRDHEMRREGMAGAQEEMEYGQDPARYKLLINLMLYVLAFGLVVILAMAGAVWLAGLDLPSWWKPALAAWSALLGLGILYGLAVTGVAGWHTLGEMLLQLGVVGLLVVLTMSVFLAEGLGWGLYQRWVVLLIPLAGMLLGIVVLGLSRKAVAPPPEPRGLFPSWPATTIRSSASLLRELGSAALLACAYRWACTMPNVESQCRPTPSADQWLWTALALLLLSWLASQLHAVYVNRWRGDQPRAQSLKGAKRTIRVVANVLIGLLVFGIVMVLLVSMVHWVASPLQSAQENTLLGQGLERLVQVSSELRERLTGVQPAIGMSLLSLMLLGIGVVILLQLFLARILCRLGEGHKESSAVGRGARREEEVLSLAEQLRAIEALARAEQRRWTSGLGEILTLLLPIASATLLVLALVGLGTALLAVTRGVTERFPVSGVYFSAITGAAYWLLRQLSASMQRHDPEPGFGDLFIRMATSIARILSLGSDEQETSGFGQPRYFVFGHDHWADSKPLPLQRMQAGIESAPAHQQWYVNSGTWLRGYVEEQREQEVSENHSTFVQIIPDLEKDAAPRVLRWNDGTSQPEWIVRRERPSSVNDLLWSRWSERRWRILVWLVLMSALLLISLPISSTGLIEDLRPLVWAVLLWWPASSLVMKLVRWLAG